MLSTADTGFVKTLYTKITPSSEVVPAKKESGGSISVLGPSRAAAARLGWGLTQQHRLLFLPVALLESSDSLLFYQVAVDVRTPGLENLQKPKRVHKLGT